MIPPFDPEGDLPPGRYQTTWSEFKNASVCLCHPIVDFNYAAGSIR